MADINVDGMQGQYSILMQSIETLKKENAALLQENRELKAKDDQKRFRTIFEESRLANKIISPDLSILLVNDALVRLLGYDTKEEIIGTHILDYSPPADHEHWKMLQKTLWNKETPFFSLETCLIRKDGTQIWCQVTSIVFPDNGALLGYTIIEDITDQHRLKLYKEEFISVASHELKTPVTSLQANLQLMGRMLTSGTVVTEKLAQMAQNAEKHVIKLSFLIRELLTSSKLEHGQLSLNKTTFKLKELVDECCSHIRLDGKYHINYSGSKLFTLFADRYKIDQVLVNLVNNAVKHAAGSFEIAVNAAHKNGITRVSVSDKGKGIASENLANLFERYFKVSKDNNRTTGLGLGLYISAEIVRLHGGTMGVDSIIGEGTTFWFTIPEKAGPNGKPHHTAVQGVLV
ncbi:MAG TPA: PAS domain-containing sensor histidine kinase [Mucilaginibacter sp.]|nr:PAS domain-containing sensor histidine kinase [Mucilaginibacter sp.]